MADLLYLVHRLPYPPNKGDKVRSYHLLQHLRRHHRVHLGTFVDDPADEAHLPQLRQWCASVHAVRLHPLRSRLASLRGLLTGDSLTEHVYRDAGLARWVNETLARERIAAAVVFSSAMAPYVMGRADLPLLADLVDVDSAKWSAYAPQHRWPMSWLYRREGRTLLQLERRIAAGARRSFFATEKEAELFGGLAPDVAGRVEAMDNGVDAAYFAPDDARPAPFAPGETPLVFTGAMDFGPNVDAVTWFAREVLPALRAGRPGLRFHIVGRSPAPAVRALAEDPAAGVVVTGTVPDVRPYLQHAAVVVAPLRLARGIQNKVLEAMAMARPVVAATACVEALVAEPGGELLAAGDAAEYVRCIELLLRVPDRADAMGVAGRQRVLRSYTWDAHLAVIDRHLAALTGRGDSVVTVPQPLADAPPATPAGASLLRRMGVAS
ncbi:MAG: TIGR03087 family PEP-CTERM/XrtA system glycosyltransferase [Rubrivivax sp.]|nr:TIGR03087 family PEP-CTERM/XrtA system glycosyltransferase [Rubrivivax sp.]